MEFQEFVRLRNRICEAYGRCCANCPINIDDDLLCAEIILDKHTKKVEQIVSDWAKNHPHITNGEKFNKILAEFFPDRTCIGLTYSQDQYNFSFRRDWWTAEYKEQGGRKND